MKIVRTESSRFSNCYSMFGKPTPFVGAPTAKTRGKESSRRIFFKIQLGYLWKYIAKSLMNSACVLARQCAVYGQHSEDLVISIIDISEPGNKIVRYCKFESTLRGPLECCRVQFAWNYLTWYKIQSVTMLTTHTVICAHQALIRGHT